MTLKDLPMVVLYDFIVENREQIIERARRRVHKRMPAASADSKIEHGIPVFLTQLGDSLAMAAVTNALHLVGPADSNKSITDSAALHGEELLRNGFTVSQVVHGYGDVCQVVTELVAEMNAQISAQDFHAFNGCLDDAISGAVTAYGRQREREVVYESTERMGILAHELRNLVHTATPSFDVIRKGTVGLGGSTGAVLGRSLSGLSTLVERTLAEVRLEAGTTRLARVSLLALIEDIAVSAKMQAESHGMQLTVEDVDADIMIDADWYLLSSALSNLLQNAFKFTRAKGTVSLKIRTTAERVMIDVQDECGGLPPGKTEELFRPFTQASTNRTGLGLGLGIAMSAVTANAGTLSVRNMPASGCVFTIDLPRPRERDAEVTSKFHSVSK